MRERDSVHPEEAGFFAHMLAFGRARPPLRYRLSGPVGVAAHGVALAAAAVLSVLSMPESLTPNAPSLTVIEIAPPPPSPVRRGTPVESISPEPEAARVDVTRLVIPDTMLTPVMPFDELRPGLEHGFDDGFLDGFAGGLPGGVVGGVPGGLVGGNVGGTGTDLPEFPTPDVGPKPLRMPPASYTVQAARENVRGSVKLRVVIDEQGRVQVLDVLRSIPLLDDEAIRTVESSWRFRPATKNGRPVACLSDLVVRFNLY